MTQPHTTRIAVVEEQIKGLREQQKAHATETKYMFASLSADVKELTAIMNRGRGAFAFAMLVSGAMGAFATQIVAFLMEKLK